MTVIDLGQAKCIPWNQNKGGKKESAELHSRLEWAEESIGESENKSRYQEADKTKTLT